MRRSDTPNLPTHTPRTSSRRLARGVMFFNLFLAFCVVTACGRSESPVQLPLVGTGGPGAGKSKVAKGENAPPTIAHNGPFETEDGTVHYDASGSKDPDGPDGRLKYEWTWEPGKTSTGKEGSFTYENEGQYEVILKVTDRRGLSATAKIDAVFKRPPPPDPTGDPPSDPNDPQQDPPSDPNDPQQDPPSDPNDPQQDPPSDPNDPPQDPPPDPNDPPQDPPTDPGPCVPSSGASFATVQGGAWSSAATWGGQGIPGCSDQVSLLHAVRVDQSIEIGRHAGSVDLDIAPGATLTLDPGVRLTVLGEVRYASSIRLNPGSRFEVDAPAGAVYDVEVKSGAPVGTAIEVRGAPGNPGVVDLNSGAGVGVLGRSSTPGNGLVDFEHAAFRGGDSGNPNQFALRNGDHFRLVNTRVEQSGGFFQHVQIPSGSRVTVENTTFAGTTGSESLRLYRWENASTPGTTVYRHTVFDKPAWIEGPDAMIDGCYFHEGLITSAGLGAPPRVVKNSLIRRTARSAMGITADYLDNLHVEDYSTANPHGVLVSQHSRGSTVSGNVFKYTGSSAAGDMIAPRIGNDHPITLVVTNNLVLPNGDRSGPTGTLVSLLGSSGWTVIVEGNTYMAKARDGAIAIAETYGGHPGMLATVNSNLAVGMGGSGSVVHQLSTPVSGYVSEARNNGYWGIGGSAYDAVASAFSGTPGSGDVFADPRFVDSSRDLNTYDAVLGGPGTASHLLEMVSRMNDAGFNPAYEPSAIVGWIKDGWTPTNGAFNGSGKNGADIGARNR